MKENIIKVLNDKIENARNRHMVNRTREEWLVKQGKLFTDKEDPAASEEYIRLSREDIQLEHIIVSLNKAIGSLTTLESLNL